MRKIIVLLAISVLFLTGGALAQTPDLNIGGAGARAIGMGGAFTSIADDATAVYWNPAGLAQLKKPELTLVGYRGNWKDSYMWKDYFRGLDEPGEFEIGSYKLNFASFAIPLNPGGRNLVFGASAHMVTDGAAGSESVTSRSTNRWELQVEEASGGFYQYSGFAAYEVNQYLLLGMGAGVMQGVLHEKETKYTEDASWGVGKYRESHSSGETHYDSEMIYSAGILVRPWRSLKAGAMYRTKAPTAVTQENLLVSAYRTDVSVPWDPDLDTEADPEIEIDFPAVYAVGLSYRLNDLLTIACDYHLHAWSKAQLRDGEGNLLLDNGRPLLIAFDSKQVRLGLEYLFQPGDKIIPVRIGYYRYNTPVPSWFQEALRSYHDEDSGDGIDDDDYTYAVNGTSRNFFTAGVGIVTPLALIDTAVEYSRMQEGEFMRGLQASLDREVLKVYLSAIIKFDIPGLGSD